MINHSLPAYIFIRLSIFALQAITPLSIAWTVLRAIQLLLQPQWHFTSAVVPLDIYAAIETLFYLAIQLPILARIQRPAEHPPLLPEKERRALFEKFTGDIGAADMERYLTGWFRGKPIEEMGRNGVKEWLRWAFFEGRVSGEEEEVEENEEEIEEYTVRLEGFLEKEFKSGSGSARGICLTLDPIVVSYRSLTWYVLVGIVDTLVYVQLCWHGFRHYRLFLKRSFGLFPLRPLALTAKECSPAEHVTYWIRPHTSKTRLPVLFIHGIGIGLYPYTNFFKDLNKNIDLLQDDSTDDSGEIGILALELMPISFRLTHRALSKPAVLREISTILAHHAYDSFVLVAHSYGTIIATHMLRDPHLAPKISSLVLVDPVCFLLHTPSVAYNFTVRPPREANEWQLWYFASKDWGVAHTLGRRFFWSENVLWREEVAPAQHQDRIEQEDQRSQRRVTVNLAGRDLIVDTEHVGRYLTQAEEGNEEWKGAEWEGRGLEVLWNEDKDHAQVFDKGWMRDRLVGVVRGYTKISRNG